MNVLLITLRADMGGGPKHVSQLLACSASSLVRYYIAAPKEQPFGDVFDNYCQHQGTAFFELPHRKFKLSRLLQLAVFCRQHHIQVVHSHGKGAGIYSRLLKLICPWLQIVHTFHGVHIGQYRQSGVFLYAVLEWLLTCLTHTLIAVSASEAAQIQGLLWHRVGRKLQVIPNGVSIPREVSRLSGRSHPIRIVVVSRFDYQKNTARLLDVLDALLPSALLIDRIDILGDGDDRPLVELFSQQHSELHLHIAGEVADIAPYLQQADILLNTSRWEGLSLAVLESMAWGVIPVLSQVPGNQDIWPDRAEARCGFLYPLAQPELAAQAILQIAMDADLRQILSENARILVKNQYNEQTMVKTIQHCYQLAIKDEIC